MARRGRSGARHLACNNARVLERVWSVGHQVPWWCFQLVAIAVGALVAQRPRPFAVGVVLAALGAVLVANGAESARFILHGGAPPELEVAGFGALAGLIAGYFVVTRGREGGALARAVGPMLAVARLGCFFAGCDFGAPAAVPWALRYPHWTPAFAAQLDARLIEASAPMTRAVHPTPLYESMLGVALFFVARRRPSLSLVVSLYAAGRFAIDFCRGDQGRGAWGLTTSQLIALGALGLVLAWLSVRPQSSKSALSISSRSASSTTSEATPSAVAPAIASASSTSPRA